MLSGAGGVRRKLHRVGLAGAVLSLLVFGVFNLLAVRPFLPGDETAHVNYALDVSAGRLPVFDDRFPPRMPGMSTSPTWTAMHPPLYYSLVALPLRVALDTGHPTAGLRLVRLLTLLIAVGVVVLTARLTAALVPGRPALAVAAAGGVALLPSFWQLCSFVYNDALSILATTLTLVLVALTVRHGCDRRRALALAASALLGAATRASGLELAALAALAALVPTAEERAREVRRRLRAASGRVALISAAVLLPIGWFYGRNLALYGSLDGSTRAAPSWAPRGPSVVDNATSARFWLDEYRQLWGYVTDNAPLRGAWAVISEVLLVAAVAGLALSLPGWLRNGASRLRGRIGVAWSVMGLHAALVIVLVLRYFARGAQPFGRYFFPLLPLLPVLAVVGLAGLAGWGVRRGATRRLVPALLVAGLLASASIGTAMTEIVLAGIEPSLAAAGPIGRLRGALALAGIPAPGVVLGMFAALLVTGVAMLATAVVRLDALQQRPSTGGVDRGSRLVAGSAWPG